MRNEFAIVEVISISKQGQVNFFEMKVPSDAERVIGIETGLRLKSIAFPTVVTDVPNMPNGNILSVAGAGNSFSPAAVSSPGAAASPLVSPAVDFSPAPPPIDFPRSSFAGELKLQSMGKADVFYADNVRDPSVTEKYEIIPPPFGMPEKVWTHGKKPQMQKLSVDPSTTVIMGFYRDRLGEMLKIDAVYDVFVYLWYNLKKPSHDC